MDPQQKAESLGIKFEKIAPGYLNLCIRSGSQLISSGHVSGLKGKLGRELKTEQGRDAARECAVKVLQSVWNTHGTLRGLRVIKVLGCVNSTLDFEEQHLVINGASDLFHEVFGKQTDGYHARSALGFASLPTGAAVEVEAIFEVIRSTRKPDFRAKNLRYRPFFRRANSVCATSPGSPIRPGGSRRNRVRRAAGLWCPAGSGSS